MNYSKDGSAVVISVAYACDQILRAVPTVVTALVRQGPLVPLDVTGFINRQRAPRAAPATRAATGSGNTGIRGDYRRHWRAWQNRG